MSALVKFALQTMQLINIKLIRGRYIASLVDEIISEHDILISQLANPHLYPGLGLGVQLGRAQDGHLAVIQIGLLVNRIQHELGQIVDVYGQMNDEKESKYRRNFTVQRILNEVIPFLLLCQMSIPLLSTALFLPVP